MSPAKTVSVGGLMALLLTGLGSEAAAQDTRPASPPVGIRSVITHRVPTGVIAPTRGDVPSSLKSPRRSSAATKASIIGLAALGSLFAIATQNQLAVLQQSIDALSKLADDDKRITLFDFHASTQTSGNFQLGAVQRSANGALSVALGAFYFQSLDERRRFLFVRWGSRDIHFWSAAQRMTLNTDFYARRRNDVIAKLEADASTYIADLKLGSR